MTWSYSILDGHRGCTIHRAYNQMTAPAATCIQRASRGYRVAPGLPVAVETSGEEYERRRRRFAAPQPAPGEEALAAGTLGRPL
ncbi:hypothetical protein PCANC_14799 [Puccinia coronata f. sp. avenae]|uniref:Uncharacterized protein n=1 Tax=Puccinia coronata f. sp. avenae TaxID=200324 RepID=A0A2N5SW66_9BASI|nr:hypothetical protein PCANC_14799 [Puccinia coronata f. sp. avenae]